jgi:hypothetical protein
MHICREESQHPFIKDQPFHKHGTWFLNTCARVLPKQQKPKLLNVWLITSVKGRGGVLSQNRVQA